MTSNEAASQYETEGYAIELNNVELLRQEGEVNPLVINLYAGFNHLRGMVKRFRSQAPPPAGQAEKRTARNAWLSP